MNVGYRYDELNRLESVDDTSTGLPTRTTSYAYNANGSLEALAQPNGVIHTYGYDALNRLRSLVVVHGMSTIHSYDYKLRASGHRGQVIENLPAMAGSAKTTTYTYDDLYRLTSEAATGAGNGNNGDIGYALDKVGNRLSRTSSMLPVSTVVNQTYNARDWLSGDTYTPNGSTVYSPALPQSLTPFTDTYDFEERLILRTKPDGTTINISYDADGHRIAKNILNASAQPISSTTWLVDTNNLTGYAQVFEGRTTTPSGTTQHVYSYGTDLISQAISLNGGPATLNYFAYDGHGSTRELTTANGAVMDRYDYDAFGNLVFQSGTTPNTYKYSGEQYDADLGLYYNRARYLNTDSGRFWSMDGFSGVETDPISLHKYLYASADPLMFRDPSGHFSIVGLSATSAITLTLAFLATPAPLNAPGPDDPTYNDTSLADLAINIVGGKILGDYVIGPIIRYTFTRIGNAIFTRPAAPPVAGRAAAETLSTSVVASFEKGIYNKIVTSAKMIVYRAEGKPFGQFFGTEKPLTAIDAEIMTNIAKWGNTMQRVSAYEIPAGTTIYVGKVAGGSGQQIFIPNPMKAGVQLISSEPLSVGLTGYGLP